MKPVLFLPIHDQNFLQIFCTNGLGSIVCCDALNFKFNDEMIACDILVCDLEQLKKDIEALLQGTRQSVFFKKFLTLNLSSRHPREDGNLFILELHAHNQVCLKSFIDVQTLASWVMQLDLLHVVAEENEKEKKEKGKGCC